MRMVWEGRDPRYAVGRDRGGMWCAAKQAREDVNGIEVRRARQAIVCLPKPRVWICVHQRPKGRRTRLPPHTVAGGIVGGREDRSSALGVLWAKALQLTSANVGCRRFCAPRTG